MQEKKVKNFTPSIWYQNNYQKSVTNPEQFWLAQTKILDWVKETTIAKNTSFKNDVQIKWFEDGQLNVCYNCVDRHVKNGKGNNIAIIWESDNGDESKKITYNQLLKEVSIFANILQKHNLKKGDVVIIYMPMIVEAAYAMLAAARIGVIHSVVFAGFSAKALADRIKNCNPKLIITADYSRRGGKEINLKNNVDEALKYNSQQIPTLIVRNTGGKIEFNNKSNFWYHEEKKQVNDHHEVVKNINSEDPLFILYTSGSTGAPKGLQHSSAGYLLYAAFTFATVFDYREGEIYWCSADIGWITGHSYVIYGPLANGATTLMFEGVPSYPDFDRFWKIIDKYLVNIFYTAPTAIRALMKEGNEHLQNTSRNSLRILGTVGEPINPEAWQWYYEKVGNSKCFIVDTWWQTETGGHMITAIPGHVNNKPASATLPFFGIRPIILDKKAVVIKNSDQGNLCIEDSWPGQARTIFGDHKRFIETYFSQFEGYYFTGDGAKKDEDGYFYITGRVDDVINVSGHRIGTAEVEAALNKHEKVCESAVVGFNDEIKGQAIYAFVILNKLQKANEKLKEELKNIVRIEIGTIATPKIIHFVPDLPKTRSGKIMRRIIRKIANGEYSNLGDLSTLTNPEIIQEIINSK